MGASLTVTLRDRIDAVRGRIARAAERARRSPDSVLLVAVTKTHPAAVVREAYDLGLRDFGENYAQELAEKAGALADLADLRWHFVGHLQRNKVKLVAGRVALVHGADSVKLLEEIGKRGGGDVLLEVNVAGEASKSGVAPADVAALLDGADRLSATRVRGLMCIPPAADSPESSRPHFRRVRELRDSLGGPARLPDLSMGMTSDFEVAIEEGATIVRVGTALFGPRSGR